MLLLQAVCAAAGIVCCLMADLAVGGIVLRVQLHSYRNPLHLDTEGDRCDSLSTRTCENKFKFCLTRSSSTTCLYRIASSSYYADDDFTFTSPVISQLGITNPLVFTNVPNMTYIVDIINVNLNIPRTLVSAAFTAPRSYCGIAGVSTMRISYQVTETTPSATIPTTEATTPTTEAASPTTEAATPTTAEFENPTTEATTPTTEATIPTTEATTPITEAVIPTTEATIPNTEAASPTTEAVIPTTAEFENPTTEATPPTKEEFVSTSPSLGPNIIDDNKPPEGTDSSIIAIGGAIGGVVLLVAQGVL